VDNAQVEHFGKQMSNTWKVLKCGAGERWRSVGLIVWEIKKYHKESKGRQISNKQ